MKSIVVLIVLGILGYWLYTFYQQNPDDLPSLIHLQKDAVSTPIPTTAVPVPPAVAPNLDSIPVEKGQTLTHARVKGIRADSLVFVCDQGLVQVTYDRLPPAFAAYYVPRAPTPTPVVTPDPNVTPVPTPTSVNVIRVKQRTPEEEEQAQRQYLDAKEAIEARLKIDQELMDQYYTQSTYNNPSPVTEAQFNNAKQDFDSETAKMSELLGHGP
jgi:hypothetical protein